ncbi:MAG: PEP-CTERM system TPR-repeat protein PrsT [Gammaproteobacteria bacterium]|nr:PEP-CTERM system TPR-repeat protein PrsT [Gammaproteobacteria bacterium]
MATKLTLTVKALTACCVLLLLACDDKKPEISALEHHKLATLYLAQGSFSASLIEAKNALELNPENVAILETLAKTLIKLGDYNAAKNVITVALEKDSTNTGLNILLANTQLKLKDIDAANKTMDAINPETISDLTGYYNTMADIRFSSKDFSQAKKFYLTSLKTDSNNLKSLIGAAKAATLLKQPKEAEKYTQLAINSAPNNIDALVWQAQVYIYKKQYFDAETSLTKAMVEFERYDTLTIDKYIAIELLSKVLLAQGKIEESFKYSNYLSQSRPGQLQKAYKTAFSLISDKNNIIEAEKAFQDVLRQAPGHAPSGIMLGIINYNRGDYSQADEYLSKFASDANTPLRSRKILILTKIKLNKPQAAIALASDSIRQYGNDADLHALLGYAYSIDKNYNKSIEELELAISQSKNNPVFYTTLASAYLEIGNFKNAEKYASLALKIKPDLFMARGVLFQSYLTQKKYTKAGVLTSHWLKITPDNPQALNASALISLKTNKLTQARTQFLKTLTVDPNNLLANTHLIEFDLKEEKPDKAYERLYLILEKKPEHRQSLNTIYQLAGSTGSFDKLEKIIQLVIDKNPDTINSRLLLAQGYLSINSFDNAAALIDQVTALDNKNIAAYLLKAKLQLLQNRTKDAINTYLLLASIHPKNPAALTELANYYLHKKNYKLAAEYSSKALSIDGDHVAALYIQIKSAIQGKNKAIAIQSINKVRDLIPLSPLSHTLEYELLMNFDEKPAALNALNKAWETEMSMVLAEKFRAYYSDSEQPDLALKAWQQLTQKQPDDLKIQVSYAAVLNQYKYNDKAITILQQQLMLHPDNVILLNNLANLYFQEKDERALETAIKAHDKAPDNPAIKDTLGWIYSQQNKNYSKALPLLEQAYQATANSEIKQHLITTLKLAGKTADAERIEAD